MLLLVKENVLITDPKQIGYLELKEKKSLYENLDKGFVLFVMPEDYELLNISSSHKNAYKVGFIFDALTETYPDLSKTEKAKIISEKYHMFFAYRQFKNKLNEYESCKEKYLKNVKNLK